MSLLHSLPTSINTNRAWDDTSGPFRRGNPDNVLKLRIWEFLMLLVIVQGYHYWFRYCRNKFSLGIYLAFTFSLGWCWLIDSPLFLRITFHPNALPFFTTAGHWEALWTAPSYTAVAMWIMLYRNLRASWSKKLPGWISISVWAFGLGFWVMILEGCIGNFLLQIEDYHYTDKFMLLGVPWTSTFLFEPLLFLFSVFFIDHAQALLSYDEGERAILLVEEGVDASETPLLSGSWTSFWVGVAAVNSAYYFMCVIMIPLLHLLQPWSE